MGKKLWIRPLLFAGVLTASLMLAGCSGDDGAPGKDVSPAVVNDLQSQIDALTANVKPESCSICHNGTVVRSGDSHQAAYDELFQEGVVTVTNVAYSYSGGNDVVTFDMAKNGVDFDCTQADSLNIYFTEYTGVNDMEFTSLDSGTDGSPDGDRLSIKATTLTYDGAGGCTSSKAASAYGDLSAVNGEIVVYGNDELVTSISSAHISLARYPFAAIYQTGAGVAYTSAANVTGCEKCHTTPYYKHGYILGDVSAGGGQDFWTCKACHIDNGDGGHNDWQYMVDDPQGWATGAPEPHDYSYKTRLMNDVHMSHAMEFPYPQSMRNCATCHAGKLTQTLSDANFTLETCRSCHPVTGGTDTADANGDFAIDTTGTALTNLLPANHTSPTSLNLDLYDNTTTCNGCHTTGNAFNAPVFSDIHTGYNPLIYDTSGNKYADGITASIDHVDVTGNVLDISISATGSVGGLSATSITPTIMVSFYGYDTKDYIISNHTRDANSNRMEFTIGAADNALFTTVDGDGSDGNWEVTMDMSAWTAPDPTILGSITDLIASGVIKNAEVAFRPALKNADGQTVGLNAVTKTVDVTTDGVDPFVADYYSGTNAIVDVTNGCNTCHDQLATTFHSGDRGGSIVVCRMCHVVTNGGSHLQGQSRSIDSYVHAVHSFQAFDVEDVDFTDPVEAAHYEEHINFLFPNFATVNCQACHKAGKFNVPDQSKSMPGLLSATDEIPGVIPSNTPEVVVGPAARACGGCHRAKLINEDDAGGYAAFNQHTKDFGYRVENDADDMVLYGVIDKIMSLFQ